MPADGIFVIQQAELVVPCRVLDLELVLFSLVLELFGKLFLDGSDVRGSTSSVATMIPLARDKPDIRVVLETQRQDQKFNTCSALGRLPLSPETESGYLRIGVRWSFCPRRGCP